MWSWAGAGGAAASASGAVAAAGTCGAIAGAVCRDVKPKVAAKLMRTMPTVTSRWFTPHFIPPT